MPPTPQDYLSIKEHLICVPAHSLPVEVSSELLTCKVWSDGVLCVQTPEGCQQSLWRFQPGGYLREILTARVYDVAVRSVYLKTRICT